MLPLVETFRKASSWSLRVSDITRKATNDKINSLFIGYGLEAIRLITDTGIDLVGQFRRSCFGKSKGTEAFNVILLRFEVIHIWGESCWVVTWLAFVDRAALGMREGEMLLPKGIWARASVDCLNEDESNDCPDKQDVDLSDDIFFRSWYHDCETSGSYLYGNLSNLYVKRWPGTYENMKIKLSVGE